MELMDVRLTTASVHASRLSASAAVLPLRTPCHCKSKPRRLGKSTTAATTEQASQAYNPGRFDETAEDYYSILGVPASAPVSQIKQTYYKTIRDCHPDIVGEADDQATEFCIFLNEIYETLSDPAKREAYDTLMGFHADSVNPFREKAIPLDQVFVDEFTCIGCKNCTAVCNKTFTIEEDYGRARVVNQGCATNDRKQEAIETCPVDCIHWVSAPQLALLEVALSRMERVHAWVLMMGGGGSVNVFEEASLAWQKRKAEAIRKSNTANWLGRFGKRPSEGSASHADASPREKLRYENSMAAAQAARRWRDFQRAKRQSETFMLPERSVSSMDEGDLPF